MNELKQLTAALAAANLELRERQAAIAEASSSRDALAAELAGLDAALEGAEIAHAVAVAAEQLGEQADTKSTAVALEDARRAMTRKTELVHRHRVAAAVVAGLEGRYLEQHRQLEALNEQHRAALVAELERRADEAMEEARDMLDALVGKGAEIEALRGLLAEQGRPWDRGFLDATALSRPPAPVAVQAIAQSIRAELTAS